MLKDGNVFKRIGKGKTGTMLAYYLHVVGYQDPYIYTCLCVGRERTMVDIRVMRWTGYWVGFDCYENSTLEVFFLVINHDQYGKAKDILNTEKDRHAVHISFNLQT